ASHSLVLLLILQPYPHLRALHSFPTRRSSDLSFTSSRRRSRSTKSRPRMTLTACISAKPGTACATCSAITGSSKAGSTGSAIPRSEEHTSELQSRSDLVCRLLLEKKKKKKKKI